MVVRDVVVGGGRLGSVRVHRRLIAASAVRVLAVATASVRQHCRIL